jgi:hypothetical protein
MLASRKMGYARHVLRGSAGNTSLTVLEGFIVGKRQRGRPGIMWLDDIRHWTGMTNYGVLKRTAEDQELWRSILSTFKIEDDT